jgi:uncharacterized membrane protein YraQ (UPF0718 family)/YHS domain-containing protein
MFFDTFWALVLGFAISGGIQAFSARTTMLATLGNHRPRSIVTASFLGAISSSCSYAASAIAKSLVEKGADFTTSIVFMFASTNLVFELGLVMWTLLGWQFAAAEFVGGFIMILLLALILPKISGNTSQLDNERPSSESGEVVAVNRKSSWHDAAAFTVGDLKMVRWELVIGFLVAGIADATIPVSFWHHIFLQGDGLVSDIENVLIGPIIAFFSFVCSVGNVPLGAALWNSGISFGGTIAFIFADLLTIPLVLIYRKFYGSKLTWKLFLTFWGVMSASGFITEKIFSVLKILPQRHALVPHASKIGNNLTTWLNFVAIVIGVILFWLFYTRDVSDESPFAIDPICGMQVEKTTAVASTEIDGVRYYFCAPGCLESFLHSRST